MQEVMVGRCFASIPLVQVFSFMAEPQLRRRHPGRDRNVGSLQGVRLKASLRRAAFHFVRTMLICI